MKGMLKDCADPYADICGKYGYRGGTIEHTSVKFLYFRPFIPLTREINVAWDDIATAAIELFLSGESKSCISKFGGDGKTGSESAKSLLLAGGTRTSWIRWVTVSGSSIQSWGRLNIFARKQFCCLKDVNGRNWILAFGLDADEIDAVDRDDVGWLLNEEDGEREEYEPFFECWSEELWDMLTVTVMEAKYRIRPNTLLDIEMIWYGDESLSRISKKIKINLEEERVA